MIFSHSLESRGKFQGCLSLISSVFSGLSVASRLPCAICSQRALPGGYLWYVGLDVLMGFILLGVKITAKCAEYDLYNCFIQRLIMSFQNKKNMLIMAIISTVVLIAVGVNYRISLNVIEATIFKHQEIAAEKTANIVEIWMLQQKKILKATLDSLPPATIGNNDETYAPLKMAMKAGHFTDVYIGVDGNGTLIDGAGWIPPPWYDPRFRPWYIHALKNGKMSFTTPYIDLVTKALVIALVSPITIENEFIGVIGADTVLDSLETDVLKQIGGKNNSAFIIEDGGTILIHPDHEYVMKKNLLTLEAELKERLRVFEGKEAQSIRFTSSDESDSILSYKKISDSSWFLCLITPFEEAKQQARKNTMVFSIELILKALGTLALIVLLSVIGSGGMIFILSQRYSSSLQEHKKELTGITKDLKWNIVKRKEAEKYYKTLFDVANDGIIICKGLILVECNKKTEEMFDRSKSALIGMPLLDLSPVCQPDGSFSKEELDTLYMQAMQGKQCYFRWYFIKNDGSQFPASVNIKSLKFNNEQLLLSSIRDISKRVDAEAQLMQTQKMAAVGEMLGMIAHQWRQPLNTLSTYISSLQAAQLNDMLDGNFVGKVVTGADDQIKFMSKTIDNFRNFFKPSKKKVAFNVFDVVFSSVKLVEAQIKNADIKLSISNLSGVQSLTIFGYKSEFVHVLINIISNARDALLDKALSSEEVFSKNIEIVISGDESFVYVDIIDNGPGISAHSLPLIFNPYYTTKSSTSGTGIGLYMAKMIVEKEMGGELRVTSQPGATKFSIKLQRLYDEVLA